MINKEGMIRIDVYGLSRMQPIVRAAEQAEDLSYIYNIWLTPERADSANRYASRCYAARVWLLPSLFFRILPSLFCLPVSSCRRPSYGDGANGGHD